MQPIAVDLSAPDQQVLPLSQTVWSGPGDGGTAPVVASTASVAGTAVIDEPEELAPARVWEMPGYELHEVVTEPERWATWRGRRTVFDSTGIALQASATVPLEYERALAAGVGVEKKMISA